MYCPRCGSVMWDMGEELATGLSCHDCPRCVIHWVWDEAAGEMVIATDLYACPIGHAYTQYDGDDEESVTDGGYREDEEDR